MLNPRITTKVPNHLPSMKPANKAIGDPNPKNGKTHKIVKIKKKKIIKICFLFLSLKSTQYYLL